MGDPEVSAPASWLESQHENLTWLGGDLSVSMEQAQVNWKDRSYVVDPPATIRVVPRPDLRLCTIGLNDLPSLLKWLGYTNSFCQFTARGWFLALVGGGCLVSGSVWQDDRLSVPRLKTAVLSLGFWVVSGCVVAWSLVVVATQELDLAAESAARGDYLKALQHLEQAESVYPACSYDSDYVIQRGIFEQLTEHGSSYHRLLELVLAERKGHYLQAEAGYSRLLSDPDEHVAIRREACRALLRSAIHAFNAGMDEQATSQLEQVLANEPCCLKANYVLQLVYLRSGRSADLVPLVDQLEATYARFRFPNKHVVLAAAHQNASLLAFQESDLEQVWRERLRAQRP